MKIKSFLFTILILFISNFIFSQVAISSDSSQPHSSAMLEVRSSTQGFLPPRMTEAHRNAIANPIAGLIVWCIDCGPTGELQVHNGTTWTNMTGGTALSYTCGDPMIDTRDGKTYATVLLGTQCWMAENLNIGMWIMGGENQTNNAVIEKYCFDDWEVSCHINGGLYQWNEAMQYSTQQGLQGICPLGWHIPSNAEWTALTDYVSSQTENLCNSNTNFIAKALAATSDWSTSTITCAVGNNLTENNATGFSGRPGGFCYSGDIFYSSGYFGYWWTSTEFNVDNVWFRSLWHESPEVDQSSYGSKEDGYSVRCLKDL